MKIVGIDNFSRPGTERNRSAVVELGVDFFHGDIRCTSDLEVLPDVDWIVDCAAVTSVTAGVDGNYSSRQLVENNLIGTLNLLEFCRKRQCGLIILSTSRVYSVEQLSRLPLRQVDDAFQLDATNPPASVTWRGIDESFSTACPTSLYGGTKLASERLAQEYSHAFRFPLWINRCGLMAGAGQFGRSDQGVFSFWVDAHRHRRPLKYIGFGGKGLQVRDCLHPRDLAKLIGCQLRSAGNSTKPMIANVSGGIESARSLRQLSTWCEARFGVHPIGADNSHRPYDLPWVVLDSSLAETAWGWKPETPVERIFDEIANSTSDGG